ncbi:MAG: flagellar hook-length control protein FliK [Fidelibacterota bacterium]
MIKIIEIQAPTPQGQPGAETGPQPNDAMNAIWFGNMPVPDPPEILKKMLPGTVKRPVTPDMESVKPRKVNIAPGIIPVLTSATAAAPATVKPMNPVPSVNQALPARPQLVPELILPRPKSVINASLRPTIQKQPPENLSPLPATATPGKRPVPTIPNAPADPAPSPVQSPQPNRQAVAMQEDVMPQSGAAYPERDAGTKTTSAEPLATPRPLPEGTKTPTMEEQRLRAKDPAVIATDVKRDKKEKMDRRIPGLSLDQALKVIQKPVRSVRSVPKQGTEPAEVSEEAIQQKTASGKNAGPEQTPMNVAEKAGQEAKHTIHRNLSPQQDGFLVKPEHRSGLVQDSREANSLPRFSKLSQTVHIERIARIILQMATTTARVTHFSVDSGSLGKIGVQFSQVDAREHVTILVDNIASKEFIDRLVPMIQENLNQKGFELSSLDVQINQQQTREQETRTDRRKMKDQWTNVDDEQDATSSERVKSQPAKLDYGYNTLEIIA